MILSQQLSANAAKNLSRAAVRCLGKEMSYNELKTKVARLSYLYQHELGHGARVAFLTRNSPSVITTFFALTNTRSVSIPVNPDLAPDQIVEWLKESKATHLAVNSDLVARGREILQHSRLALPLIEIEKKLGGEYDPSFTPPPDNAPKDTDTVLLLRTAGTAGQTKLIAFNHVQIQHAALGLRGAYHASPTDRFLTTLSWAHPFAFLHGMLLPFMIGATCVIDGGEQNKELLDLMLESRVTRIAGTPSFFLRLLMACKDEKRMLPGVKSVTIGLGLLSPELRKAFSLLKVAVSQTYGQTEAGWTLAMGDTEETEIPSERTYIGKGLAGLKYKVLDANGDEVEGKGAREGMLAVTGPCVMGGYFEKEKETKTAIRGTWLYTGDMARLDGEGETLRIHFLGRKDDVLQQGSKILSPVIVDTALRGVAGIQDAAGVFLKNSKGEPSLVAIAVKAPGSPMTEKQALDACAGKLGGGPPLAMVIFTDLIPRDAGGNVNRAKLRAQFSGALG